MGDGMTRTSLPLSRERVIPSPATRFLDESKPSFRCVKISADAASDDQERHQPPPPARRRRGRRGARRDRPRRPAQRPRRRSPTAPRRRAAATSGHAGHGELPARHLRRRQQRRPPRQRLRPDRAPARLRLRQDTRLASGRVLREWEIVAQDKEIEVAPGVKYEAWTYNGRVPGPTLRAREGELLRIRFVNASEHPHTMHFHGIHTALMDGMPGIGETAAAARSNRARASPTSSTPRPSASTSTTATSPRSPPTSPAASTAPSSSTPSRGARKPTRW